MSTEVIIGLNAVIIAVTQGQPRILTVHWKEHFQRPHTRLPDPTTSKLDALPFGPLNPTQDRTLELAVRGWVKKQTGLDLGYVEQLYTFGDRYRDPREREGGPRMITVAYLALVQEDEIPEIIQAQWRNVYDFFPWEDWRQPPPCMELDIHPTLCSWSQQAPNNKEQRQRQERIDIAFGLGDAGWDNHRVLERYELLYETGSVFEANPNTHIHSPFGKPMILDHRRILASAISRIRGKLQYRPLVFELLPHTFTLLQLQLVVEALSGLSLHKQNFRRFIEKAKLVEPTGEMELQTGGRPAALFRFRRDVLTEHSTPGIGLPKTTEKNS